MPKRLLSILQVLALCIFGLTMLGADSDTTRFDHLGHQLVCQCGCGQILLECNHVGCPVSGPMVNELHAQLGLPGASNQNVLNFFINKYGPIVLAAPIRGGFDNAAWIVPIAGFILALGGVALLIRLWHRRRTVLVPAGGAEAALLPHMHDPARAAMTDRIRAEASAGDWDSGGSR